MKIKVFFGFLFALILTSSIAWASGKIPSLVGKWNVESSGGVMLNAETGSKETHWSAGQKTLKGQIDIASQDDRFVVGTYTSARGSEKFVAMITPDGKYMYASDTDGFFDCKIVNRDTLEIVYRHAKPSDSVVAIGVAKRQK